MGFAISFGFYVMSENKIFSNDRQFRQIKNAQQRQQVILNLFLNRKAITHFNFITVFLLNLYKCFVFSASKFHLGWSNISR